MPTRFFKPTRIRAFGIRSSTAIAAVLATSTSSVLAVPALVLSSDNSLRAFDTSTPGALGAPVSVTGLGTGEDLLGIDFRPATGALFGLGNLGQLYSINAGTGAATAIGSPLDPGAVLLNGSSYGVDFNPTVDRVRVTSDLGENYRLNPNTGALVAVDGGLAFAAGDSHAGTPATITEVAYSNNDNNPATGTTLYGIDSQLGALVIQNPPNDGTLNTVGSLGVATMPLFAGFDIVGVGNSAFALTSFDPPFGSAPALNATLYSVNLTTGAATSIGTLGDGSLAVTGFALYVPEPASLSAIAFGTTLIARRRR